MLRLFQMVVICFFSLGLMLNSSIQNTKKHFRPVYTPKGNLDIEKTAVKAKIISPKNPEERGCQLSITFEADGRAVFEYLAEHGIVVDWRESNINASQPAVIRLAPVPLYNTFTDVYEFALKFEQALKMNHG